MQKFTTKFVHSNVNDVNMRLIITKTARNIENPIKCEKCQTFCKNKAAWTKHMKCSHPKNTFQRDLCAKFVIIKRSVTKHMKLHISRISNLTNKNSKC